MKIDTCKLIISPKKSLGQNFLSNPRILDKIISAAEVSKDDIILEIGPGTGNLTEKLSEKVLQQGSGQAGRVVAVEKDRRLIPALREKFKNTNVEILEADVLKLDIDKLFENCKLKIENCHYKVVGNIPYYITSHLLKTIFEEWPRPKLIVLMVQKEVAQRIVACPPDMSLLALSVQFYSVPQIISYVSKGSFRPMPKVDSAIISLKPKAESLRPAEKDMFFKVIKAGFQGKRKQLANNLSKNLGLGKGWALEALKKIGLNKKVRAENLSIEQWKKLSEYSQNYLS